MAEMTAAEICAVLSRYRDLADRQFWFGLSTEGRTNYRRLWERAVADWRRAAVAEYGRAAHEAEPEWPIDWRTDRV